MNKCIFNYVSDMIHVVKGYNTANPLVEKEIRRQIQQIEDARNISYEYPALTIQEWVTARDEWWRIAKAIQQDWVLRGKVLGIDHAKTLYQAQVHTSISDAVLMLAYQKGRSVPDRF